MENTILQLNKLRAITADEAFKTSTRDVLLNTSVGNTLRWYSFTKAWSFAGLATLTIATIAIVGIQMQKAPAISESLNTNDLNKELQALTISIELNEITYRQAVDQTIVSALSEISNEETQHLHPSVIEDEKNLLNVEELENPEINNLLDKILF